MPITTPNQKIQQVKKFGKNNIEVILFGENFTKAYEKALEECRKYNKIFIHPFDDINVITGQATVFYEILNQSKLNLDYLFIPIGGGGLISGAINVFKQLSPDTKIIGIEPMGAPSMSKSIKNNKLTILEKIDGFVDGVAVKKVGNLSFDYCKNFLDDIVILEENEICNSLLELLDYENIKAEPAGAMSSASLRHYQKEIFGKNVGCIICGGNNDNSRMPEIRKRAHIWKSKNK
jgi:threonine dehydratase